MGVELKILHAVASADEAKSLTDALAPVRKRAATVLLATPALEHDPQKHTLTQLALAAHARRTLVVVSANGAEAPLGLRDLPKLPWTGAPEETRAILKAVRRASRRRRGWAIWLSAAAVLALVLLASMWAQTSLFESPPASQSASDLRGQLIEQLERGMPTPEQVLQLAELLEQEAPELRALRAEGYSLSAVLDEGALPSGGRALTIDPSVRGDAVIAHCIESCVGFEAQLTSNGSPIAGSAATEAVRFDIPGDAPAPLTLTLACESCSYVVLHYTASRPAQQEDPLAPVTAQLDDLRTKADLLDARLAEIERTLHTSHAKLDDLTLWMFLTFGVLALLVLVLLLRALGGGPSARARAGPRTGATTAPGPLVFASYSRQDRERVDKIVTEIEGQGVDLWVDRENIGGGSQWPEEIVRAIRNARGVILFCSPHSFESDHVLREVSLAAAYGKPLLPVQLEPARPPDGFLYYLSTRQIIDLAADPAWRAKLMAALRATA